MLKVQNYQAVIFGTSCVLGGGAIGALLMKFYCDKKIKDLDAKYERFKKDILENTEELYNETFDDEEAYDEPTDDELWSPPDLDLELIKENIHESMNELANDINNSDAAKELKEKIHKVTKAAKEYGNKSVGDITEKINGMKENFEDERGRDIFDHIETFEDKEKINVKKFKKKIEKSQQEEFENYVDSIPNSPKEEDETEHPAWVIDLDRYTNSKPGYEKREMLYLRGYGCLIDEDEKMINNTSDILGIEIMNFIEEDLENEDNQYYVRNDAIGMDFDIRALSGDDSKDWMESHNTPEVLEI